jgi:hypothetical protein
MKYKASRRPRPAQLAGEFGEAQPGEDPGAGGRGCAAASGWPGRIRGGDRAGAVGALGGADAGLAGEPAGPLEQIGHRAGGEA